MAVPSFATNSPGSFGRGCVAASIRPIRKSTTTFLESPFASPARASRTLAASASGPRTCSVDPTISNAVRVSSPRAALTSSRSMSDVTAPPSAASTSSVGLPVSSPGFLWSSRTDGIGTRSGGPSRSSAKRT